MPILRSYCEHCRLLSQDQQLWNDFCQDCLMTLRDQMVRGRWQLLGSKSSGAIDFWIQNFRLFQYQLRTSKLGWKGTFCSLSIQAKGLLVRLQDLKVVFGDESIEEREEEDWTSYQLIFRKMLIKLKERWPIIWI